MASTMRRLARSLAVTVTALTLSCARGEPGAPPPAPAQSAPLEAAAASGEVPAAPGPFDARLLDAARAYTSWPKVTATLGWGLTGCAAPRPPPTLHASDSKDDATHGQKLYHLFAQNRDAYVNDYKKPAPTGQVLVKESWHPIPASLEERNNPSVDIALRGEKLYRKGEKKELFLMLKLAAEVEGTDHGWVYGVVSGDGARVIAAGKLANCAGCHANAPGDRLFGPPT